MSNRRKLTKSVVDKLSAGITIWDEDVRGFGVRRQRSEARMFFVKAKEAGRQRWITIGRHGSPWTVETARTKAKAILGAIAAGESPASVRDETKRNPVLADYAELFISNHVEAKQKHGTQILYRDLLARIILPDLGQFQLNSITHAEVAAFHRRQSATPYQANRCIAILSKLFTLAERDGFRPANSNPCRHIEKFKEEKRERFLSEPEFAALGDVLARLERDRIVNPYVLGAIRLLIFTGARLREILTLKWSEVDLANHQLRLGDSKTGVKSIYLSPPATEILTSLPRLQNNPYVIVGNKPGACLVNLEKPWRAIRAWASLIYHERTGTPAIKALLPKISASDGLAFRQRAWEKVQEAATMAGLDIGLGLSDVRLHDLRHSYASTAAIGGLSLPMIGKLLGHTQVQTTARYSHLSADPVRAANEGIGMKLAELMRGTGRDTQSREPDADAS